MFEWVCEVGDIVSTNPTLMHSLCPNLQGGLLGLSRMLLLLLLLAVLSASMLLIPGMLLAVLAVLSMLVLLLQRCSILL